MKQTGVIVARFQTPYLHEGHLHLIKEIKAKHHKTVVVLGISPVKGSKRNPFDFYTRERLLKASFPDLIVLPLRDEPSDEHWSVCLDTLLKNSFPAEAFVLYGSRDSFMPYYHGTLAVQELAQVGEFSATTIRDEHADHVLDTKDFRLGINYAYHNLYSKVYPTVDIAVLKEARKYLLLGKKSNRVEWRLPGGFVDPADSSFEIAAHRELMEECGSLEVGTMQYAGSFKIDDWRYRCEDDKIITTLFITELVYGTPIANDDLESVRWFPVATLQAMIRNGEVSKEHIPLINKVIETLIAPNSKLAIQSEHDSLNPNI